MGDFLMNLDNYDKTCLLYPTYEVCERFPHIVVEQIRADQFLIRADYFLWIQQNNAIGQAGLLKKILNTCKKWLNYRGYL